MPLPFPSCLLRAASLAKGATFPPSSRIVYYPLPFVWVFSIILNHKVLPGMLFCYAFVSLFLLLPDYRLHMERTWFTKA